MIATDSISYLNTGFKLANDFKHWCNKEIIYLTNGNTLAAGIIIVVAAIIVKIALVYFVSAAEIIFGVVSTLVLAGFVIWLIHDGRRKEQNKVVAAVIHHLQAPIDKLLEFKKAFEIEGQSDQSIDSQNNSEQLLNSKEMCETALKNTIEKVNKVILSYGKEDPIIQNIVETTEKYLKLNPTDQKDKTSKNNFLNEIKEGAEKVMSDLKQISDRHHELAKKILNKII
jgi:hypothetical protein